VNFALEAASNAYGKHPSEQWLLPTLADVPTLLRELDLPRLQAKAAISYRRTDLLVLNAGGGNKGVPAIDHHADSVLIREWNAHMKLQTA
jgi:hypothetical protein